MDPDITDIELDQKLKERFRQLPKVVQDAIKSTDVQKNLRALAESQKLHVDQWDLLENQVLMTLLGFQKPSELVQNIRDGVDVSQETAGALAEAISRTVFEPIREELERELGNPEAKEAPTTPVESARAQILAQEKPAPVPPATPPAPAPTEKAVRAPISESYKAGEPSTNRKSVHDDPYRESPL